MTLHDLHYTCVAMRRYGGSFVNCIASAIEHADETNRQRLIAAFPDLIEKYGPGSLFFKEAGGRGTVHGEVPA